LYYKRKARYQNLAHISGACMTSLCDVQILYRSVYPYRTLTTIPVNIAPKKNRPENMFSRQ